MRTCCNMDALLIVVLDCTHDCIYCIINHNITFGDKDGYSWHSKGIVSVVGDLGGAH